MEITSALILMQEVVDHYAMNFAQREAWQTLKTAVSEQTAHNNARDEICPICKGSRRVNGTTMWVDCFSCHGTGKRSPVA